jgi:flagellar hook-length control protein FliK
MKVNEVRQDTIRAAKTESGEAPKKSGFSKLLQKEPEKQEPGMPPLASSPAPQPQPEAVQEGAPVRATVTVRDLDNLALEVTVAVRGSREVEIQFDSKTLDGLNVRIEKEEGKLHVRLATESADVKRMLTAQTEALTNRLEARGYPGAVVQVQSAGEARPARSPERNPGGRQESGGQGGRQGKRK